MNVVGKRTAAVLLASSIAIMPVSMANAKELRLWEKELYDGDSISFSFCNADFQDNTISRITLSTPVRRILKDG
ncbi:hypothetical protein BW13_10645 [Bifidobacterium sp. UTCIF-37]|nr:hypothetical protein BW13_10645 [Bifidobacterium sp. UTCIF-37]TPF88930.1 hypothetical protein BW11_06160 [Bifidobacterium sp. UTCIF-38]